MAELDPLRDAIKKMRENLVKDTLAAFVAEAEIMKNESMDNTPVQYGVLKASHEVVGPVKDGNQFKITIQVGGPAEDYALAVHEHLSDHSPPSWVKAEENGNPVKFNGGGPKFLENAVRKGLAGLEERVAERVKG